MTPSDRNFEKRIVETTPSFEGFSPLVSRILAARGIADQETLERFLYEKYDTGSHDPFLMKDMERVVARLQQAFRNNETIALYSDYDADGIPGSVALSRFLEEVGFTNKFVYIPQRGTEGFGLNKDALDEIIKKGADLLITIDCGIAGVEEVAYAQDKGVDVIITDHHIPHNTLPPAYAILNPKQESCTYPYKELCGAGVVYKLIQALASREDDFPEGREKWYLDLVGIATLADMVPLTGENRVFARYGLFVLRKSRRHGLNALFRASRVDVRRAVEDDVSFTIAPRINAASRMADPHVAFNLLSTDTHEEARSLAQELEKLNRKRKTLVARIVKDAKKVLDRETEAPVIVTGNPQWRPGILGLVANALVETYDKPAFVWGREPDEEGVLKGSARSDGRVDLVELMKAVPGETFTTYGGHKMSGGFSVEFSLVHDLPEQLAEAYRSCAEHDPETFLYDADLTPQEITRSLFDEIEQLAPFGVGNEKPLFRITGAHITQVRLFGKEKNHIEIRFDSGDRTTTAIGFFMASELERSNIQEGKAINFLGSLEKSYFGGSLNRRMRIVAFE